MHTYECTGSDKLQPVLEGHCDRSKCDPSSSDLPCRSVNQIHVDVQEPCAQAAHGHVKIMPFCHIGSASAAALR